MATCSCDFELQYLTSRHAGTLRRRRGWRTPLVVGRFIYSRPKGFRRSFPRRSGGGGPTATRPRTANPPGAGVSLSPSAHRGMSPKSSGEPPAIAATKMRRIEAWLFHGGALLSSATSQVAKRMRPFPSHWSKSRTIGSTTGSWGERGRRRTAFTSAQTIGSRQAW